MSNKEYQDKVANLHEIDADYALLQEIKMRQELQYVKDNLGPKKEKDSDEAAVEEVYTKINQFMRNQFTIKTTEDKASLEE